MAELTERSRLVLRAVRRCAFEGRMPSVRELCRITEIPSASSVWKELNTLEEAGFIRITRGSARGITLCETGRMIASAVPLITAIDPITKVTSPVDSVDFVPFAVPERAVGRSYAMRVPCSIGDMKEGDIAVFCLADTVENGREAAIMFNGALTVGRVTEEANGSFAILGGRRYRLGGEADMAVVGRFIGLVRRFL